MNEIHVLINSDGVPIGAFSNKSLIEEYVTCPCEDECESCESLAAPGKDWSGELYVEAVALNKPSLIRDPKGGGEATIMDEIHVLSNGFGEILGASSDKALLEESVAYPPEDKCQYCESYESCGEACPYRQLFIDTVALGDPSLIAHCKARIAKVRAGIVKEPLSKVIPARIKVNGAETMLEVRSLSNGGWEMCCVDPLVGEFHIHSGDELHLEFHGEWVRETESVLWLHLTRGQPGPKDGDEPS
jgi:hypothetical protein